MVATELSEMKGTSISLITSKREYDYTCTLCIRTHPLHLSGGWFISDELRFPLDGSQTDRDRASTSKPYFTVLAPTLSITITL